MLYEYEGAQYEALSLALARAVLNAEEIVPGFVEEGKSKKYSGLEWLQLGDIEIPVDGSVNALVPYRGRQKSFPYISATSVLDGSADPDSLKGRVALVVGVGDPLGRAAAGAAGRRGGRRNSTRDYG